MWTRALQLYRERPNEQPRSQALCMSELSMAISAQGRSDEAEALQREALAKRLNLRNHNDLDIAESYQTLGSIVSGANRASEAEVLYRRAPHIPEPEPGPKHWPLASPLKETP